MVVGAFLLFFYGLVVIVFRTVGVDLPDPFHWFFFGAQALMLSQPLGGHPSPKLNTARRDPAHFAYPTYAKAAMQRRKNLKRSAAELKLQLDEAKAVFAEAFEEMKKIELFDEHLQMSSEKSDSP